MAEWEEKLGLKNVRPFDRPMLANENDKFVGQDELGNNIYETMTGSRYTIRPATAEESKTTRAKVEDWVDQGAPLPSWEQIGETIKAMPGAMYDSAARVIRGDGTVGEALSILPASGAAGLATRIGQEIDDSVISAMGATHRVPSYKPVDDLAQKGLSHDEYGNTYNRIEFSNPLADIVSEMEVPNNGLKGSQLIKELQDNPTVRNSQLRSEDWLEAIDPQKRYTKEDIQALMEGKGWTTFASPARKYRQYQRQYNLVDKEVTNSYGSPNYVEYAIQAAPNYEQRGFKANSQHYTDDTVAHVRLSERLSGNESYVLVEELQSDLLQQGFQKPSMDWEEAKQNYLKNVSDPTRFHIYNQLQKDDLLEYGTLITEHVNGLLTDSEYVEEVDKLLSKLQERMGLEKNRYVRGDIYDVLMEADEVIPPTYSAITSPPVAKTEETVRLGLQTAMAHAYNQGLTKVVIPPFDEIVAKRFTRGSAQFSQAMDPKSGFYATYVKGVQKALRGFQDEFGDKVKISSREMEYDPNAEENSFDDWVPEPNEINDALDLTPEWGNFESPEQMFFSERFRSVYSNNVVAEGGEFNIPRNFGRKTLQAVDEIGEKVRRRSEGDSFDTTELTPEEKRLISIFKFTVQDLHPGRVSLTDMFDTMLEDKISLTQAAFKLLSPKKPKTEIKQGIEIDFSGLVEDKLDLSKPRFAEGGVVENNRVDPVSGNPVPPGATPKEVRDDVDIKASEGEYIIPANVVRYLGLDKIEKMVNQAKEKLAEMESNGRMGGEKGEEDDLPFGPEELMTTDGAPAQEKPRMAEGGLVKPRAATPSSWNQEIDPATGKPRWAMFFGDTPSVTPTPTTPTPVAPTTTTTPDATKQVDTYRDRQELRQPLSGLAGSVDTWTPSDFVKYNRQKTDAGAKAIQGGIASVMPFGGFAVQARNRYLNNKVPEALDQMISTGKDLQGNPLSERDLASLREVAASNPAGQRPERKGLAGLFSGITEKLSGKSDTPETVGSKSSSSSTTGDRKELNSNSKKGPSGSISLSANKSSGSSKTGLVSRPSSTSKTNSTSKSSSSSSSSSSRDKDSKSGRR